MLHRLGGRVTGVGELGWVALDSVGGFKSGVGGVGGSESVAGGSVVGLVVGVVGVLRWVGSSRRARWYLASWSGARVSSAMGVGLEGEFGSGGVASGVWARGDGWVLELGWKCSWGGDEVAPGRGVSAVCVGGMFGSFWVSGMVIGWVWAVCRH